MKPLFWVASAKKDLLEMPEQVVDMDLIEARLKLASLHSKGAQT